MAPENRGGSPSLAGVNTSSGVTVSVEWGYELHSLTLSPGQWASVLAGEALSVVGAGYHYEGQHFQDYWHFGGGLDGDLTVEYGDDGGTGFIGSLDDAIIEEAPRGGPHSANAS